MKSDKEIIESRDKTPQLAKTLRKQMKVLGYLQNRLQRPGAGVS